MMQLTLNILLQAAAVAAGGQDYATAHRETNETGRPLVILVGAEWCPGCRQMKYSAIPEVAKRGGLSKVSFAYVNTDEDHQLASKLMQGNSIPQLIMFHKTETGWKRTQLTGAHAAGDIEAFLEKGNDGAVPKISSRQ